MKHLQREFEISVSTFRLGGATDEQLKATRQAFFAGAQAFYKTVMSILDPGMEPTMNDMRKMQELHDELEEYKRTEKPPMYDTGHSN